MKKKSAIFLITIEWNQNKQQQMTAQMARDKLFTPLQELWMIHAIDKLSIEELEQKTVSLLMRGNEKGKRESYYKTSFPKNKKNPSRK